jgi:nicotinamidase-related amidase
MGFDRGTTAVVLIEYQNDFVSPGGALHDAVREVMDDSGMLANSQQVLRVARTAGVRILHVPIMFAPGYPELGEAPFGILRGVVDAGAFAAGSWGAAFAADLAPEPGEIVVEGKRGLDAFASTNLDFVLRAAGVRTIALGGFLTNCCVESTLRTGYERGYHVIALTDCVAATSRAEHENALRYDYPMFAEPMTAETFATAVQAPARPA